MLRTTLLLLELTLASTIHRRGGRLVDETGEPMRLKGVGYMGSEYSCVQHHRVFAGPSDARIIAAWQDWGHNAVRLPLNEDCWLGKNGAPIPAAQYRSSILNFTEMVVRSGMTVVLDLHWTSTDGSLASKQAPMLSADSLVFWKDLASTPQLKSHPQVVFELFNEPFQFSWKFQQRLSPECFVSGSGCQYKGYQQAIDAVRSTGATNLLIIGTDDWTFDLHFVMAHAPVDPLNNSALAWHPYESKDGGGDEGPGCGAWACHAMADAAMAAGWPVILTEFGPKGDSSAPSASYTEGVYSWARASAVDGLFAWAWFPGSGNLKLLDKASDWYGSTPSAWGRSWKGFSFAA